MKNDYPIIKVKNNQTSEISYGWLVGSCLVVVKSKSWEIWSKHGVTLFRNIETKEDAVELSEWLQEVYCSYFLIWEAYPEIDIFELTMWTVREGLKMFETIEKLRTMPRITWKLIMGTFKQSTGRCYYQNYMKEARQTYETTKVFTNL